MLKMNSHFPKLYMKLNGVKYKKGLCMRGWPFIFRFPGSSVSIGENVRINSEFFSNLLGLYQRTIIIARSGGQITIGDNVGISGSTIYARGHITIGDHTVIGANCKILDNDFHSLDPEERDNDIFDNLVTKDVILGKSVFVGCNSILLKGTEVGDRSIIGAGSVVSGKFPPDSVIAGNPAKIIRMIDHDKQTQIQPAE